MARELPLNGLDGRVTVVIDGVDTDVAGLESWEIGADSRTVTDVPTTFGTERDANLIQQKGIISWSVTGFYLLSTDAGQNLLRNAYNDRTELTGIKFWIDNNEYVTPISGDHVEISEMSPITQSATGFATWGASGFFYLEYETQTVS